VPEPLRSLYPARPGRRRRFGPIAAWPKCNAHGRNVVEDLPLSIGAAAPGIDFALQHFSTLHSRPHMTRTTLRWWLWVCFTVVVLAVAGLLGFYGILWREDLTGIGFGLLALYALSTGLMFWKIRSGDGDFAWPAYIAENMERAGIFGTFVGLAIAFRVLGHMDAGGAWKQELMLGVSTKFFCSIVGMAAAFMLRTQIKILAGAHES
jgi:hypothetical protein